MSSEAIQDGLEVIIVNWNTSQLLHDCLTSLFRYLPAQLPPNFILHVTVVDNASSDASVAMVGAEFPQVQVKQNSANLGFAAANNIALASGHTSFFLLLNSDTLVLENSLSLLLEFMQQHPDAGVCGPRLLNKDNTLQTYCWKFPYPLLDFLNFLELYRYPYLYNSLLPGCLLQIRSLEPISVDFLSGACLLVRHQAYEQVGGLDSAYFFYNEESDWCYRFRQAGWKIWFVPRAELIHLGGQSSQRVLYSRIIWFHEGYLRFYRKFYSRQALVGHRLAVWAATLPKLLILLLLIVFFETQKRSHRRQLLKAYWEVLWLSPKP